MENVSGVEKWADQITLGLEGHGYTVSKLRVSAEDIGAPHLRRRVFFVANLDGKRLEVSGSRNASAACGVSRGAIDGNAWLSSVAGILRVVDGVPGGVDRRERIEKLGNAVVPQVGEWIGRRILEASERAE